MIYLILKSYLSILLSVGASCLLLLGLGLYWIFKPQKASASITAPVVNAVHVEKKETTKPITVADVAAIAGESVLATQLDLARAYIETGKGSSAKSILKQVIAQGNEMERQEAEYLLGAL